MDKSKNFLIVHADLQHVSVLAEIEIFGHSFESKKKKPMDFFISSKFDPEISGYLEIGEKCVLHEKEPMSHALHGYQSDGVIIPLDLQEDCPLPPGIYPLRAESKKSGEWARFFI